MRRLALAGVLLALTSGCGNDCDPGDICTWYGTPQISGMSPDGTDRKDSATFWVTDVSFNPVDNSPAILDWNNHRVVSIDENDQTVTLTGIGGLLGDGPEGDALQAEWNHPTDIDWLSDGTLVLAAWHNSRVITLDPTYSEASFLAGTGGRDFSGDGGPAKEAVLDLPVSVRVLDDDTILVADMANQRIRSISPDGIINTVAGSGMHGFNGDGPALETMLASPALQRAEPAFKMDLQDDIIYLADTHNGRVRMFDTLAGTITTLAGTGKTPPDSDNGTVCTSGCGYSGDGGPANEAELNTPSDVAVASDGTVYVADTDNSCIRAIDPSGTITTFAGQCGNPGYDGEGGPATEALLNRPFGVSVDNNDVVYISDTYNSIIRRVTPL